MKSVSELYGQRLHSDLSLLYHASSFLPPPLVCAICCVVSLSEHSHRGRQWALCTRNKVSSREGGETLRFMPVRFITGLSTIHSHTSAHGLQCLSLQQRSFPVLAYLSSLRRFISTHCLIINWRLKHTFSGTGLCGLVVRVLGYTTEMYCASCEVRTEFIYVM
jgi:hypothetical protein